MSHCASWCVACRKDMPTYQAAAGRLEGEVVLVDARAVARSLGELGNELIDDAYGVHRGNGGA